jgi:hypothetical protein
MVAAEYSSMLMRRIVKIFYESDVESAQQCPGREKSFFIQSIKKNFLRLSSVEKKLFVRVCMCAHRRRKELFFSPQKP